MYDENRIVENLKYWKVNGFDKKQAIERVMNSYTGIEYEFIRSLSEKVYAKTEIKIDFHQKTQKSSRIGKKVFYSFGVLLLVVCVIAFCVFSTGSGGDINKSDLLMEVRNTVNIEGREFRIIYYIYDYDRESLMEFPYAAVRLGEKEQNGIRQVNKVEFFYGDEEVSDDDFERFLKNISGENIDELSYSMNRVKNYGTAVCHAVKQYLVYEKVFPSMSDLNRIYLNESEKNELADFYIFEGYAGAAFKGEIKDLIVLSNGVGGKVIVENLPSESGDSGDNFPNNASQQVFPIISR